MDLILEQLLQDHYAALPSIKKPRREPSYSVPKLHRDPSSFTIEGKIALDEDKVHAAEIFHSRSKLDAHIRRILIDLSGKEDRPSPSAPKLFASLVRGIALNGCAKITASDPEWMRKDMMPNSALMNAILQRVASSWPIVSAGDTRLPFDLWRGAVMHHAEDLDQQFRVFTSLYLMDSVDLATLNAGVFLTVIDLSGESNIDDQHLLMIRHAANANLVSLNLSQSAITDDGLRKMFMQDDIFPRLELLKLQNCQGIKASASLVYIARLHALGVLDIRGTRLSLAHVSAFGRMKCKSLGNWRQMTESEALTLADPKCSALCAAHSTLQTYRACDQPILSCLLPRCPYVLINKVTRPPVNITRVPEIRSSSTFVYTPECGKIYSAAGNVSHSAMMEVANGAMSENNIIHDSRSIAGGRQHSNVPLYMRTSSQQKSIPNLVDLVHAQLLRPPESTTPLAEKDLLEMHTVETSPFLLIRLLPIKKATGSEEQALPRNDFISRKPAQTIAMPFGRSAGEIVQTRTLKRAQTTSALSDLLAAPPTKKLKQPVDILAKKDSNQNPSTLGNRLGSRKTLALFSQSKSFR